MTRRPSSHHARALASAALACATLAAALPAAAGAAWTPPQDLGIVDYLSGDVALESNARGDAVAAFASSRGMYVARATAGEPFGARVRIDSEGFSAPHVAIDARGVALIAWEYDDGSFYGPDEDRGFTSCCTGTKVLVWQPGRRPSPARLVRPRGLITYAGPVAAVSGRRGMLVRAAGADQDQQGALQFVPIRLDGRPGKRRTIPGRDWDGGSLGFVGGRAIAGLTDPRGPTRLGVRSQRANGTFGALRVFLSVPERIDSHNTSLLFADLRMASDERGGQLAVLERGRRPNRHLQLIVKPRGARVQRFNVRRGPADDFFVGAPSASPDGWTALAFARPQTVGAPDSVGYVVTVSPSGRMRISQATTLSSVAGYAASVTRGGAGAAAFSGYRTVPPVFAGPESHASFTPLAGGRLRPAGTFVRGPTEELISGVATTSNPRDRARVVWQESGHVLAIRLE